MSIDASSRLVVVVALLEPVAVGATFSRREWPAHVTLASNFVVAGPPTELEQVVRDLFAGHTALTFRFTAEARFGPNRDVPVQLVESAQIDALHERLADMLEAMPGFAADQPAFWRRGYRPHMTHVTGVPTRAGTYWQLPYVAIAQLTGGSATVSAAITLPLEPATPDQDVSDESIQTIYVEEDT